MTFGMMFLCMYCIHVCIVYMYVLYICIYCIYVFLHLYITFVFLMIFLCLYCIENVCGYIYILFTKFVHMYIYTYVCVYTYIFIHKGDIDSEWIEQCEDNLECFEGTWELIKERSVLCLFYIYM